MHSALRKEFENLKSLSQEEGSPLAIIETKMENAVFVSNGEKLVCLVVEETKIHNVLTCFKVNLKKWEWAADEGFTMEDGIPKELADEILIKFQTPSEYLGYLGF
jgi:hypothetical protein